MNQPSAKTCRDCGREIPSGPICSQCSFEEKAGKALEVEYRDFRGSEMLDIRMAPPRRQQENPCRQKEDEDVPARQDEGKEAPEGSGSGTAKWLLWIGLLIMFIAAFFLFRMLPGF